MDVAKGHVTTGLAPLVVEFRTETPLRFETVATSDGLDRVVGGASLLLEAGALDKDEYVALLQQLGLSVTTPSARVTVRWPDWFGVPRLWHGVVTVSVDGDAGGWWERVRLSFSGLVEVAL